MPQSLPWTRSRGRTTSLKVSLTPEERQTLKAWQWQAHVPWGQARRGRILLLVEEGLPITQVAQMVGISRRHVYTWVRRFLDKGVRGIRDTRRPFPQRRRLA